MKLQLVMGKPVEQDGRRMSVISRAFTLKSVSQRVAKLLAPTYAGENNRELIECCQMSHHKACARTG
ncbi:hypothetical protein HPB48_019305 [Haemaphysalis longicornis]|uniref:Uncharacterized protein n=1 Tax=Haemaphysalis longicornis TaxID=44386 RepID=A0A9J6GLZ4_HAELO|nr:hypothetical protein HPB48_019305 [Haemaphysalis longicornis]